MITTLGARRKLLITASTLCPALLGSCLPQESATIDAVVPSQAPLPSHAPSPTSLPSIPGTSTPTPSPKPAASATPDRCDPSGPAPLVIVDDDTYFSFGPPSSQMDAALFAAHPEWEDFRQVVLSTPLTAGNVYEQASFGGSEYGVNPAILFIAVSMRLGWQVPPDGDLFIRATQAAEELYQYYVPYYTEETVRQAYPTIGNASTYSLYRFFGKDLSRVQEWCITYEEMFGAAYPLRP